MIGVASSSGLATEPWTVEGPWVIDVDSVLVAGNAVARRENGIGDGQGRMDGEKQQEEQGAGRTKEIAALTLRRALRPTSAQEQHAHEMSNG